MNSKSPTDEYWNRRALTEPDPARVNMPDTVQRDFELTFVMRHLDPAANMVEIGCGNGYVSQQLRGKVSFLDAFDHAENMIERARSTYGETNNRFFHDSVLAPRHTRGPYDIALCVRVLMNLASFDEQKLALANIASMLKPGGRLILIEGFADGFEALTNYRNAIGLPEVVPASHNFHSRLAHFLPVVDEHFVVSQTWNTGLYDFLTRIVFPQLVGAENATQPGEFHAKVDAIVRASDAPDMAKFARVHGFALVRR